MGWQRSHVPIERYGVYDPEPDLDGPREPLPDVALMLASCSPLGRQMVQLVAVGGLTVKQAAHRLHVPLELGTLAHDGACVVVAGEFRRLGWTEEAYREAIGG